jgi:phytoene dehydrogenase-like protein
MHTVGAYYPRSGLGAIANALTAEAKAAGVRIAYGQEVTKISQADGRVTGATVSTGEFISADAIIANAAALNVTLNLLDPTPQTRRSLEKIRLQSPGVCAYLAVRARKDSQPGTAQSPYVRFRLPGGGSLCRFLVQPGVLDPDVIRDGWQAVRLLAPMRHEDAERIGRPGQQEYIDRLLDEDWWQEDFTDVKVLETCLPVDWGDRFHLYRNSMNPVMTARWMGFDHFAHRSPIVKGLYLCGSATYPGYSVSFCTISGILAANQLMQDHP